MTSPAGTVNYTFWIDGALKTREVLNTSGNPVTHSNFEYNPAGMLKTLTNKTASNGSTRSSYDMSGSGAYDGVLNLESMAASVSGLSSFTGTLNWNYDSRERLTSETSSARSGVMGSATYDGADNVLTRGSSGWSYNSNNQITPASGQWSYDGNGNATLQRGRSCGFDPFNRLGTITQTNTWSVGYTYRADGLMASRAKTIYMYAFGQWTPVIGFPTYFFHDGGEPILEMDEDFSEEGSGLIVSAINVRGPDGLIARKQGGSWIYYDFDQQGSVSQRLNSSGTVLSSSVYDAYGAETNNGTPTDPFGYNAQWGYWFDRDTGMYLCQARWYDPATGRWVNRDPIGYAGGVNLYGYCGGGPVGGADPGGEAQIVILRGAGLEDDPAIDDVSDYNFVEWLRSAPNAMGRTVEYLDTPSETEAALAISKADVEEIWVVAHCSGGFARLCGGGARRNGFTDSLFDPGLVSIARRGYTKKLDRIVIFACNSASDKDIRELWLGETREFTGFTSTIRLPLVRLGLDCSSTFTSPDSPRVPTKRPNRRSSRRAESTKS